MTGPSPLPDGTAGPGPEAGARRPALPPGPYLVVGLARSGAAAARMLTERGAEVIGCDAREPEEASGLDGVELHLGTDGAGLVARVRTVVKSPGVPAGAPAVLAARRSGVEVVGELELAWRLVPAEFLAVTGTNGKTTTVELLGEIYRQAGLPVTVAGNVGTPLSSLVGAVARGTTVVCEASSFQLEDASAFAPECAVLLNLAEDHLDRHGTLDAYRQAKLKVFARQRADDVAVVPARLEPARGHTLGLDVPGLDVPGHGRLVEFGGHQGALAEREGALWWGGEPVVATSAIRLRGAHNLENATAAAAASLARGVEPAAVRSALEGFAGVRHRLEEVALRDGVLFVNDSKATNVESAKVGIEAFEGGLHLILGGSLKGGGFSGLRVPVVGRCRTCYLIGEAADQLARDLDGTVPLERCGELERAFAAASRAARPGEVVLLSPACASFDHYRNFEARGDHFRALATG